MQLQKVRMQSVAQLNTKLSKETRNNALALVNTKDSS